MEDDSKDDTHQTQEGGTTTKNIDFNKNQMYSLFHSIRITIFFFYNIFFFFCRRLHFWLVAKILDTPTI